MPNAPYEYFASRRREDVERIVALEKNIEHAILMRQSKENIIKVHKESGKNMSTKKAKAVDTNQVNSVEDDEESIDRVATRQKNPKKPRQ